MSSIKKIIVMGAVVVIIASLVFFYSWSRKAESDTPTDTKEALVTLQKGVLNVGVKPVKVRAYPFQIRTIGPQDDYYYLKEPVPLVPKNTPVDEEGVPVFRKDGKVYNHPVRLGHHAIFYVNSYRMTKNPEYLKKAEQLAERLAKIAVHEENRMYFPYDFDVYLHNIPSEHFKPKWYSGMAQGQALSAFSRLYQETKNPKYLKWADETFNSLVKLRENDGKIWVSMVDDQQYFWIEEYPTEEPTHVLNGYIYAIFGVYDYYQITKKEEAKNVLMASMTTIHDNIHRWRVPGDLSRYGLKYEHQSKLYHKIHIHQLQVLYKITGASRFKEMSELFTKDKAP
jgi:rhamnogalacturonyl hydrolase YesR